MNCMSTSVPIAYVLLLPLFVTLNHHQVTADAWVTRVPQLIHVGSRYNKPLLEGIWLTLMFM